MPDLRTLLELTVETISEASAIILRIRDKGFRTEKKSDSSPVTEADHASESCILEKLRRAYPDIIAISEEEFSAGIRPATGHTYWLIDPLDGTRGFASGGDDYAVNIGLISRGEPVLGVVAIPSAGQIYGGGKGLGAFRQDRSGRHEIHTVPVPKEGLRVLASRHYGSEERLHNFLAGKKVQSIGNMGSAVKIVRIAEGNADFYPRFGPTMEWDTAAPQAILEAAGGHLYVNNGARMSYDKKDRLNPPFYCSGSTIILPEPQDNLAGNEKDGSLP